MKKNGLMEGIVSGMLILALVLCPALESFAQSSVDRSNLLENGMETILRVDEYFKPDSNTNSGVIRAVVDSDVYSADGSKVLIKGGTPATIEYSAELNSSWGKAGKVCLNHAYTRTVDNKRVALRLGSCRNGDSNLAPVVILSVIFFPIGLISGLIKGTKPEITQGSTFTATVMQDMQVE